MDSKTNSRLSIKQKRSDDGDTGIEESEEIDLFLTNDTNDIIEQIEQEYPLYWDKGELKESVAKVAKKTEGILQSKNIDPRNAEVIIATDFDGPINTHNPEDLEQIPDSDQNGINVHPGFEEAWKNIPLHQEIRNPAIISNRSTLYLQNWLYNLDSEVNYRTVVAGDGGRTYSQKSIEFSDIERDLQPDFADIMITGEGLSVGEFWNKNEAVEDKVRFEQYLLRKAAENGRKIVFSRKIAPEMGTINYGGSGLGEDQDSRTGIWTESFYADEYGGTTIEDIWSIIENLSDAEHEFERPHNGDTIVYEDNFENALLLNEALNMSPGALKFSKIGENPRKIAFTTYHFSDTEHSHEDTVDELEDVKEEFEQDTGTSIDFIHNGDGWTDYMLEDKLKQNSVRQLVEEYPNTDSYGETLLFYMGDSPSDFLTDQNNITFVQEDYPAEEVAPEKGVLYGTAQNAVDYVLGVSDVLRNHKNDI